MNPSQIFSTPTSSCFSLDYLLTIFLKLTTLPSTIWYYVVLILTNLKCSFDVLLLCNHYSLLVPLLYDVLKIPQISEQALQITRHEHDKEGGSEHCAVCLDQVEEGEEIGELRCFHVFHKLCLERWVRLKHMTCPLCRGSLAPPMRNTTEEEIEREVLFFKFCFFDSEDDDLDSWWLR
ncbi:E3 ubiquitin-protein ligase RHA2A [Morus notabilis]|uniref:E3 ubiquitin-protein ligase RHA2A n=1 Tax=Morus notabilis TaxID=981085 RepID=W9QZ62_9ROSA|nr:E3 ubiquitin-protein ligase RNF43 [Morus notabilis]EXB44969.1 E3 ubiquitin-protein ligase RHA2A [Morus notabilis]